MHRPYDTTPLAGEPRPSARPAFALDAPAIDHVGITVPDARSAAAFFEELIGTRIVLEMRPGEVGQPWKDRFAWQGSSELTCILMLATREGARIELFEFSAPDADKRLPSQDDAGGMHIAFRAYDINRCMMLLQAHGLRIVNEPLSMPDGTKWFYFVSPWGALLELVFPEG